MYALDLAGVRFGRLVGLRRVGTSPSGKSLWLCACDCGAEATTRVGRLKSGHTRSCGCLQRENLTALGRDGHPRRRVGHAYPDLWQAAVTYRGAHARIRRARGPAAEYMCPCGAPAEQWSYNHADPDERHQTITTQWCTSSVAYSLDPGHYEALCKPCHARVDAAHRQEVMA